MKNIIIFLVLLISPIVLVNLLHSDSGLFFAISPWLILVVWIVWGIVRFFKKRIFAERAEYIKNGWHPLGGVSAAAFGISPVAGNQYIQAVVKY